MILKENSTANTTVVIRTNIETNVGGVWQSEGEWDGFPEDCTVGWLQIPNNTN